MNRWSTPLHMACATLLSGCTLIDVTFVDDPTPTGGSDVGGAGGSVVGGGSSRGGAGGTGALGGGGALGGSGGMIAMGGADPCAPVTVEQAGLETFDDPNAPGWCSLQNGATGDSILIEGGRARVRTISASWNHEVDTSHGYGPLLYRRILGGGDFAAVARMNIYGTANMPPDHPYQSGGLMVRRPNDSPGFDEDFVTIGIGSLPDSGAGGGNPFAFGTSWWSMEDNISHAIFQTTSAPFDAVAVCRLGDRFEFWAHSPSQAWQPAVSSHTTLAMPPGAGRNIPLAAEPVLEVALSASVYLVPGLTEAETLGVRFIRITNGQCEQGLVDPATLE